MAVGAAEIDGNATATQGDVAELAAFDRMYQEVTEAPNRPQMVILKLIFAQTTDTWIIN
jgi:hypothetical protein